MSLHASRPLLSADPQAAYLGHAREITAAVERVLASGSYVLGPEVDGFEQEFSAYQGGGATVGVANGTEALELALRAAHVRPGDAVATVANTVTATVTAIVEIGARPLFVEIDPATMTMAPDALEAVLARERVAAVVPVHLYGHPAEMPLVSEVARHHGAVVIEDCAQAHGATIGSRRVGTWGDYAAFSFYPTKNLGGLGDGGAVFMTDPARTAAVRALRQYGWKERYVAAGPGRNSRLDELQAAILRVKLPHLDRENQRRRSIAAQYLAGLGDTGLTLPSGSAGAVYHQFVVRTPARDDLRRHLARHGIHATVLYPVPVHRQPGFAAFDSPPLRETERACAEVLSLPVHPTLRDNEIAHVVQTVQGWRAS